MPYSIPELTEINFELEEYTTPALDAVNFELREILIPFPLGLTTKKRLGKSAWADPLGVFGIYRSRVQNGIRSNEKLKFYSPTNPQTEAQQANRQKIADAVTAWQALTNEQKAVYNKKAISRRMSGYNLFIKEHLLSN